MLRAIFTSKQGLGGLFVALFGAVWWFLGLWQAFDFLQNNKPVLANLLDSFWGPLLVMVLGFVILYRAVSARWPASQPPETETRVPIARAVSTQNEAVGKTHRDPLQVEEETDEEFLIRRCREVAQRLFHFLDEQGYSRLEDPNDPEIERRDDRALLAYNRGSLRPEVRNLLRRLEERGFYRPETLKSYERQAVANPLSLDAIERIANLLNEIGHDW